MRVERKNLKVVHHRQHTSVKNESLNHQLSTLNFLFKMKPFVT